MELNVKIVSGLDALPAELKALGSERVMVITGPGRRFFERLPLEGFEVTHFDGARVHVPRDVVDEAKGALEGANADTVVSLGGGSATGLAKALRLETEGLRFVAIPTTFAGSEMTSIWGITHQGDKRTGRDPKVRPDVVIHEPALFADLPRRLMATSLMNALAHPIGALSTRDDEPLRGRALSAIRTLSWALEQLLEDGRSPAGRRDSLRGMAAAAALLDDATFGVHHEVAHELGGRFGLDHAGLHALLLPHSVRHLATTQPEVYEAIAEAAGHRDLPAQLYDGLTRAGAARSLIDLGVDWDAFETRAADAERLRAPWVRDALHGSRPSIDAREWEADGRPPTRVTGPSPADAARVVLALHGRGANAGRMTRDVLDLLGADPHTTVVAPQAPRNEWYAESYRAPRAQLGEALSASLAAVGATLDRILADVPPERVFVAGFSQGACLACELVAQRPERLGGLIAIAGARVGPAGEQPAIATDLSSMPAVLGVSDTDRWLDAEDVEATAAALEAAGAAVTRVRTPGDAHEMSARQRVAAREILLGVDLHAGPHGFGNAHQSEALPGAVPRHQNAPRRAPYGLYPELVSGTGFLAPRHHNQRAWLYRIRPSASHRPFAPLAHPTFLADWDDGPIDPNLRAQHPLPEPTEPTDFVDGVKTIGGAGHPRLRRGYAIHLYTANRSMEHRAFYDADGDLLIIPQHGALSVQTELGVLEVTPGQIAIVPRGLKLSVHLHGGFARGYIGEVYGRHFELPERGPLGSNGLTDPRHFRAPAAFFEDRVAPGYRLTAKLGNALYEATQDHSPYDVVGWHGDYAPYVYDLMDFSPAGNTRFDHPDPSVHVVIGAPLDEVGADSLDFVFFPPRWDPTEHTFRPPFMHRNAITEFNGIIADPSLRDGGPFEAGGWFSTPSMTGHGVLAKAVEAALRRDGEAADRPVRISDESKWFQFESTLPLGLTSWARDSEANVEDWPSSWGSYRRHFDPRG